MKITDLAVRYRTTVTVVAILLVVIGLVSYVTIPKEAQPSIEIPTIVVTTIYPGASPGDVESIVTKPVEREIRDINGIDVLRSTSVEGVSTVIVEFTPAVSNDEAYQKVRDKVDIAKSDLPEEVEEPMVNEIDLSELPVLTINLAANYPLARLKEVGEDLQESLESLPDVLNVDLVGGLEREVQVRVDRSALQGYGLSFTDVIRTIQNENSNIPGGSIDVNQLKYSIRTSGQFSDPAQIEDLVIKYGASTPGSPTAGAVRVRDVADVVFGFKERSSYSRLQEFQTEGPDGELHPVSADESRPLEVISLNVSKRSGANILETVADIQEILQTTDLPRGTEVVLTGDRSEQINILVNDLENNIISGLIFVVAVLLFFLGVRNALLVGIAIPLSMFTTFMVLQALGYTLNFIILFSLIIALGMLVDNAVVVVENIYRFREEGYSRWEAARLATAEVGTAVTAATATTVAAFVPMLFWPGIIGEFMSFLPITLIVTLSCSLFVALVINPVITGYFVRVRGEQGENGAGPWPRRLGYGAVLITALIIGLANPISLAVLVLGGLILFVAHRYVLRPIGDRFLEVGLPALMDRYRAFLKWTLRRQYTSGWSYLRNGWALGSLALAFGFGLLGGAAYAGLGQLPAMVFLIPAGVLGVVSLFGIVIHTAEALFRGRGASIGIGLLLIAVGGVVFGLLYWTGNVVDDRLLLAMGIIGGLPIVIGAAGMLRRRRGYLLLSDNRALMLNATFGALFAIAGLFQVAPTGVEFFPDTDPSLITVNMEAPLGTNLETSYEIASHAREDINRLMGEHQPTQTAIKNLVMNVGVGSDQMFGGSASTPERSRITLNLVDYEDRAESSSQTMQRLRDSIGGLPGTEVNIDKQQMGPPTGPPINIEVSGEDFDQIVEISQDLKSRLREGVGAGALPGLVDIRDNLDTGRPEMQVRVDRDRASRLGISTTQIASTIRTAIQGSKASTYRDGEDEYDITVQLAEGDRQSLESLRDLTLAHRGQQIPITSVADFTRTSGLGSITRKDFQRVVTVEGSAAPGYNGPDVLSRVQQYLAEYEQSLPAGYTIRYTGGNEEQQESFDFLTKALFIGASLILLLLLLEFNSLGAPLIIMLAVALSLIGVLLGLILTRTPFSLFTFIGIISLAGIVVNNAIVLVDYIMQLRVRGYSKLESVVEGGATRLRPVLLTALTTILGLIPLTLGINVDFVGLIAEFDPNFQIGSENTQFWGPMGTAIISGLTFATFLTLVVVPTMYSLFDSLINRLTELFTGRSGEGAIMFHEESVPVMLDGDGERQPADEPVPAS